MNCSGIPEAVQWPSHEPLSRSIRAHLEATAGSRFKGTDLILGKARSSHRMLWIRRPGASRKKPSSPLPPRPACRTALTSFQQPGVAAVEGNRPGGKDLYAHARRYWNASSSLVSGAIPLALPRPAFEIQRKLPPQRDSGELPTKFGPAGKFFWTEPNTWVKQDYISQKFNRRGPDL